jgi:hypothetical protein
MIYGITALFAAAIVFAVFAYLGTHKAHPASH